MTITVGAEISDVVCIDGKRHVWDFVSSSGGTFNEYEERWCSKCGCRTEFMRRHWQAKKLERCLDYHAKTGKKIGYSIEVPEILQEFFMYKSGHKLEDKEQVYPKSEWIEVDDND